MIYRWTMVDADGRVLRAGSASYKRDVPEPGPGEVRIDGEILDGAEVYVDNGEIKERPHLSVPNRITHPTVGQAVIGRVPVGSEIYRAGELVGESDGSELKISRPKYGSEQLRIKPPFPLREAHVTVVFAESDRKAARQAAKEARRQAARNAMSGLREDNPAGGRR